MILNVYADPVQGITLTAVGENGAHAIPTTYSEYRDELAALLAACGGKIDRIDIAGNEAFAAKIAKEIEGDCPNVPTMYAWKEEE